MKPQINFSLFIENRIANIRAADSFAFAAAIGLGPWVVPQGPAILFGYALWKSAPPDMADFRLVTAVAVAIGLVVAGAVSSHNAITSGGRKAWALVFGYIVLEIAGLWAMSVSANVKVVGTVASLITLIVYLCRSSAKEIDLSRSEAKEASQVKMDFQIEQARLDAEHKRTMAVQAAELKHAEKLARIEAQGVRQPTGNLPVSSDNADALPEWLPELPKDAAHFRKLVGNGSATVPPDLSGAELGRIIGKSSRTGQNWLAGIKTNGSSL